jgi:hypothetical protein
MAAIPRQPLADCPDHDQKGKTCSRAAAAAAWNPGCAGHRCPQRLHHEQPAAGGDPLRHCGPAQATLKRSDLYGKTGTTNDSMDTWFAGFQPDVGRRRLDGLRHAAQTGGPGDRAARLSLPVWIGFMEQR